jgi:hypothetical protein
MYKKRIRMVEFLLLRTRPFLYNNKCLFLEEGKGKKNRN